MPVSFVSPAHVPIQPMRGRTLQWLVTRDTLPAQNLSVAVMRCEPGAVVRPLHAHRGAEELVYILEGQAEVWVDGETAALQAGDAVLFPPGSKHMTRNPGDTPLVALAIFAPPTTPEAYALYEDEQPW